MPEYRVTRFINTRKADTSHFTADNYDKARQLLLFGYYPEWNSAPEIVKCDVSDEIFALHRRKDDGGYEVVAEEIQLPGEMPYSQTSRQFVLNVAALAEEGAYDDAIETLQRLIDIARALCGSSDPSG